jgi:hypothetical protein
VEAQNSIDAYSVVRVFTVRKRLTTQNRQSISLGTGKFQTNQTLIIMLHCIKRVEFITFCYE